MIQIHCYSMKNIIALGFLNGGSEKGDSVVKKNFDFIGSAEFLPDDGFVKLSMYLTIHLSRLETESQNQTHQTHPG